MKTIDRYNEVMSQIRELEKEAAQLKDQLKKEYEAVSHPFIPNAGVYATHSDGTYEVCYWNYKDKTIYIGGPLFNERNKLMGRRFTISMVHEQVEKLQSMGYTLIN